MKHISTYEQFIAESLILEFGDASNPFKYKGDITEDAYFNQMIKKAESELKHRGGRVDQMPHKDLTYTVFGDKATYVVNFGGYVSSAIRLPGTNTLPWFIEYDVSFNVKDAETETETNFGEQYRLMATVTQICLDFIKAAEDAGISIRTLGMFPKNDEGSGSVSIASRRGRLYLEYVKKNIKKLTGNWTAELASDGIILHSGTWSGAGKEWIYNK
jgi:hypothetical protein